MNASSTLVTARPHIVTALFIGFVAAAGACGTIGAGASESRVLELTQGKQDNGRTIRLETIVACPPERTFALWSTNEGVRTFFAPAGHIGRGMGDEYTILFSPARDPEGLSHGTKGARIIASVPGRFLAFEWITFAGDSSLGPNGPPVAALLVRNESPLPTWVEIALAPTSDEGTRVQFRHYGFRDGELWSASQEWFTRAWQRVLAQLEETCRREKAAAR
jgi:uncharacterized protein YndB with AHSA1/START domain